VPARMRLGGLRGLNESLRQRVARRTDRRSDGLLRLRHGAAD